MDKPAPPVTACSWVVLDRKSKEVLFGRLEKERREVASLTKVMTLYTVLSLIDTLKIDILTPVLIDISASDVTGTSAGLVADDTLTINELLHGLMLPSGNDAAHMLALYFGTLIMEYISLKESQNDEKLLIQKYFN
jgi:D-alanyl-D-alanine carboxypeptidase (penicillin-binding protein 5/6)